MNNEIVIIDRTYKYKVDEIMIGGIGYVRLMTLNEISRRPPGSEGIPENLERKYPYRNQLAAKTINYRERMNSFSRACELWCELNEPGVVPLLKTVKNGDELLALMPRYAGNMRTLLQSGKHSSIEILKALYPVINGLLKMYTAEGFIHLAIKPENILYCYRNQKLVFELSDWGIACVQAGLLPDSKPERVKILDEFKMIPYLAPERFENYIADIRADIFSLGMIFFEIFTGCMPYGEDKSVADQIVCREYYDNLEGMLGGITDARVINLLLRMLHPEADKRIQDYGEILVQIDCM